MEQLLSRHRWLSPVILLAAAVLMLQHAFIPEQPGYALSGTDFTGGFYPLYSFSAEQVAQGQLPLWNPRQYAGFPVAGNPQAAVFYPGTWLVWALNIFADISIPAAMGFVVVLHVALAAWGMQVLMRRFGATYAGALAAAVIYSMSGWAAMRIYAGHFTILTVYAWIPFILAGYHYALEKRTLASLIPATAALGIAMLAGHPQMVLYAGIGTAVMWGYHVYCAEQKAAAAWGAFWRLALIGAFGLVLGLALIVPTLELTLQSNRTDTTLFFVNQYHLPPQQLLTILLPYLYGNPTRPPSQYWGVDFIQEVTIYVGLLPIVALLLVMRMGDRRVVYWLALTVLGVVLALGADGVLFALLVRWLPGFDFFRAPARFLYFTTVGFAGLAALLLTHLQTATDDRRKYTLAPALQAMPYMVAGLFIASAFYSGWFASASHQEVMPVRASQTAGVFGYAGLAALGTWGVLRLFVQKERLNAAVVLALVLLTWDVWRVSLPVIVTADVTDTPIWDGALASSIAPGERVIAFAPEGDYWRNAVNNASITGHHHIKGYDPLEIQSYVEFIGSGNQNPTHPVLNMLGIRYIFSGGTERYDPGYTLAGLSHDTVYYENSDPFPRAWVAYEGMLEPDPDTALNALADGDVDPRETVILEEPLDCALGEAGSTAQIAEYTPNEITIEVEGSGGVLVLSDTYYPGWQAYVGDERVDIRRAYTALRGVCVPAGDHTVIFVYRPLSVLVGGVVSGIGWAVLGVVSGGVVFAGRRRTP
ncbi:MAG: YfhO family protein [Chloroflexota bacterium]